MNKVDPTAVMDAVFRLADIPPDVDRVTSIVARTHGKPHHARCNDWAVGRLWKLRNAVEEAVTTLVAAAKAWGFDPNAFTDFLARPSFEAWSAALREAVRVRHRAEVEERLAVPEPEPEAKPEPAEAAVDAKQEPATKDWLHVPQAAAASGIARSTIRASATRGSIDHEGEGESMLLNPPSFWRWASDFWKRQAEKAAAGTATPTSGNLAASEPPPRVVLVCPNPTCGKVYANAGTLEHCKSCHTALRVAPVIAPTRPRRA